MDDIIRATVCQCLKCNEVFDYSEKYGEGIDSKCPYCNGKIHIIQFANENDERFLNRLSITFND